MQTFPNGSLLSPPAGAPNMGGANRPYRSALPAAMPYVRRTDAPDCVHYLQGRYPPLGAFWGKRPAGESAGVLRTLSSDQRCILALGWLESLSTFQIFKGTVFRR